MHECVLTASIHVGVINNVHVHRLTYKVQGSELWDALHPMVRRNIHTMSYMYFLY